MTDQHLQRLLPQIIDDLANQGWSRQGMRLPRPALAGEVVDDLRQEPLQVLVVHAPILPAPPAGPYNSRARQELFTRAVFALFMLLCSFAVSADDHARLYQAAGWPEQRAHFGEALKLAQQRYQGTLPPAVFQALVTNSNRRFEPAAMDQRAQAALRTA